VGHMNRLSTGSIPAIILGTLAFALLSACARQQTGPDKQYVGTATGAVSGAGAGAITGFQLGAGTGPGALIGAGFGAVAGGVKGIVQDAAEEESIRLAHLTQSEREISAAHEILHDHYKRRMELHPTRDIYPADIFFEGDEVRIKKAAIPLIWEIARLNKTRMPWSRMVVASYARAKDDDSAYALHLAERRSRELSDYFVRAGIEPRRMEARGVIVDAPLLIDPYDDPFRYNQAIEIIMLDR